MLPLLGRRWDATAAVGAAARREAAEAACAKEAEVGLLKLAEAGTGKGWLCFFLELALEAAAAE